MLTEEEIKRNEAVLKAIIKDAKENELEHLKKFRDINIATICKKLNVNRSNLMNGNASAYSTRAVLRELIKELQEYIDKMPK